MEWKDDTSLTTQKTLLDGLITRPMQDYDIINTIQQNRWHIIPENGLWTVFQHVEHANCLIALAIHEDLREAVSEAEVNGSATMAEALAQIGGSNVPFSAEYTINPGEEPLSSTDPNVAFLQLTAAEHPGLKDEARRLIHLAAEAQNAAL